MVFLIQNTQNRGTMAIYLKPDELIRAVKEARNSIVDLENVSDEELEKHQGQFQQLREQQGGVIEAAKSLLEEKE